MQALHSAPAPFHNHPSAGRPRAITDGATAIRTRQGDPSPTTAPKTKAVITTGAMKPRGEHGMADYFTDRISIRSNQADADAEWMLENILCRRNAPVATREKVAAYLILIAADMPRGGKMTAKRARARGGEK